MKKDKAMEKLQAVLNTLNAVKLRVDEFDAVVRVKACADELEKIIIEGIDANDHDNQRGENL